MIIDVISNILFILKYMQQQDMYDIILTYMDNSMSMYMQHKIIISSPFNFRNESLSSKSEAINHFKSVWFYRLRFSEECFLCKHLYAIDK